MEAPKLLARWHKREKNEETQKRQRISNSNTPVQIPCHLSTSPPLPTKPTHSRSPSPSPVTCMAPERDNCCTCCLSSLVSLGLSALFLWLTFRTEPPKCLLQSLYLPSLNATSRHKNDTVVFQLELQNDNKDKGVKYDAVRLSFALFVDNATTRPLANATLGAFYQGRGKTARRWGSAVARGGGVNRTAAAKVGGRVFLRVEFATRVKYKIWMMFYVRRHRLVGGANVEVNASSGEKVGPKGIRLGDAPPRLGSQAAEARGCYAAVLGVLVTGLFLTAFT
ncbi:NDR1 protein [Spatholobus suberectus]|nr:NDR1 protein [Spatholobus suberectus]